MPPKVVSTRSSSEIFLVGFPRATPLCANKVLTNRDVISYLHFLKGESNKSWEKLFSCPKSKSTRDANCLSDTGCLTLGGLKCVVSYVRKDGGWDKSGLNLKSDMSIDKQARNLFSKWQSLVKSKSKTTDVAVKAREEFKVFLDESFDASHPDVEKMISQDRLRNDQQKTEDLAFLKDLRGPRLATLGSVDLLYEDTVQSKILREQNEERKRLANQAEKDLCSMVNVDSVLLHNVPDYVEENPEEVFDQSSDDLEKAHKRKIRVEENSADINVKVPKNIVEILAPTASRYNVSSTALSAILLKTVSAGGGDIERLPISIRQNERNMKKTLQNYTLEIQDNFTMKVQDKWLVVHFDRKKIKEFTANTKTFAERLPVVISSPDLDQPQLS